MIPKNKLPVTVVRQLFDYDPLTGVLSWAVNRGRARIGQRAGTADKTRGGKRGVVLDRVHYTESHIIWAHVHGVWPLEEIDHRDHDPSNNRIKNLRAATRIQNLANRRVAKHNASKLKGVRKNGKRFGAMIRKDGQHYWLGTFDTPQEAHAAYIARAQQLYGAFAHG